MAIECISISLYDTTLPAVDAEILDFAERGSINLVYEGGDNKFLTVFASRLEFSLEVSIEDCLQTLVYDYLFTGSETRYLVVIRDQDENILWQGFLLPEEYKEPLVTGTFYVNLTATDGLGRLRGHTLENSFYRARHSVIKVIADCLKKTGLSLPIWVDPAIFNVGAGGLWENIYVDAQIWYNDGNRSNCYDILESLVKEMGCTLYQQNNKWYVQSIAKKGTLTYTFRKYTEDGVPNDTEIEFTDPKPLQWYATPQVSIKAPFREITVTEGIDENINIFPEDLITQEWTKTSEPQDPPYPKYWIGVGLSAAPVPVLIPQDGIAFDTYDGEDIDQDGAVGFFQLPDIEPEDKYAHYITLKKGVYVKGGDLKLDFDFTFTYRIQNPEDDNLDFYISNNLYYELTLDGTPIISNKPGFAGRESYLWKGDIIWTDGWTSVTGVVKVKGFKFPQNGFVNFKFFHGQTSISPPEAHVRFMNFSLKYQKEFSNIYRRRRNIDYTTTQEVNTIHGGSVFEAVQPSFIYQPAIAASSFQSIPFAAGYEFDPTNNNSPLGWCLFIENPSYTFLFLNRANVYVKRENSDFYEYVDDISFIDTYTTLVAITLPDGHLVREADSLLVRTVGATGSSPQTSAVIDFRERWQNAIFPGEGRFRKVLAEMMHNIYATALIAFEGDCKGLVFPKDIMEYEIKGLLRKFTPVRISIKPNENITSATLIEYQNEKVTNYGS